MGEGWRADGFLGDAPAGEWGSETILTERGVGRLPLRFRTNADSVSLGEEEGSPSPFVRPTSSISPS